MTTPATSKYNAPWISLLTVQLPVIRPGKVRILPVNEDVGRRYLNDHRAYLHRADLTRGTTPPVPDQIPLDTEYLAYVPAESGDKLTVARISRWWGIGTATAIPFTGIPNWAAIMAEPDVLTLWDDPMTLVELDPDSEGLTWPTGYEAGGYVRSNVRS
ncbi:MAG: hypothetical protein ACRDN0_39705, partial [Trebonia sp.]